MEAQTVAFLFLVCLPVSVCLWSGAMVAGGYVASVPTMPWEFRLAVKATGAKRAESLAPMAVPGPLLLLAFFNLPVPLILVGPYGPISSAVAIAYVLVQLLWLARIRRAVRRNNTQQR